MDENIDLPALLRLARDAARRGADIISRQLDPDDVSSKSGAGRSGDVVSRLDVEAERAIRSLLNQARPDDRIVGEELEDSGAADARISWSIDPLDGTSNKVKGLPFYCASVAARDTRAGHWLVGAINAPEIGTEHYASRGGGAWLVTATGTRRLHGPDPDSQVRLLGTGFSYDERHRAEQVRRLTDRMPAFDDLRSLGSAALALCNVADGSLDAFIETDLQEHDWAAGALIAEEAGATVQRPPGYRGPVVAHFDIPVS